MLERIPNMFTLALFCVLVLGCDPVFVIQGDIYTRLGSDTGKNIHKIAETDVLIQCHKNYIPSGLQTKSDDKGFYRLRGIGVPKRCELIFRHPHFKTKVIKLEPNLHKAPDLGWYGYKVDVELEPK